jgi:hypothetical protein
VSLLHWSQEDMDQEDWNENGEGAARKKESNMGESTVVGVRRNSI